MMSAQNALTIAMVMRFAKIQPARLLACVTWVISELVKVVLVCLIYMFKHCHVKFYTFIYVISLLKHAESHLINT